MEWQVLVELGRLLGLELPHLTAGMIWQEISERVPPLAGPRGFGDRCKRSVG
jgi:hypothetical protein